MHGSEQSCSQGRLDYYYYPCPVRTQTQQRAWKRFIHLFFVNLQHSAKGEGPYFICITNNSITNLYFHRLPSKGYKEDDINPFSLTNNPEVGSREDGNLFIRDMERWSHLSRGLAVLMPAARRAWGALSPLLPGSAGQNPAPEFG